MDSNIKANGLSPKRGEYREVNGDMAGGLAGRPQRLLKSELRNLKNGVNVFGWVKEGRKLSQFIPA
jgi:hypothetical protein